MDPGGRSISLRPKSSCLPKVLSDRHVNILFILSAYDRPAVAGESGPPSDMLCPVRALAAYVERTWSVRTTDQLFVYGESPTPRTPSKQRLSLDHGNDYDSMPPGWRASAGICGGTFNEVWLILGSTVRGVPLADICAAASWASFCIFARYYQVNVAPPSAVGSAVLGVASPSGDCAPESQSRAGTSPLAGQVPQAPTTLVRVYQYIGVIQYSET
jgi:hypothetical protein